MPSNDGPRVWETSDLGTAAFVHMKGLRVLGVSRGGPRDNGRYLFRFSDPENRGSTLQVDYLNSECKQFDDAVRGLKKLCYDNPTRPRVRQG